MDNFNDPFIIQLPSSSYIKSHMISQSAYSFLGSDLGKVLSSVSVLLIDDKPSLTLNLIEQVKRNKLPMIYKGRFGVDLNCSKIVKVLEQMIGLLKRVHSPIAFTTETELISIFKGIFDESMFESEIFCLISSTIYRGIKETTWDNLNYFLFIHLFLLSNSIFYSIK